MVPLPHRASQVRECPIHLSPVLPPHTPLTGCPSISASEGPWAQSFPLLRDQRAETQAHGVGQLLRVTLGGWREHSRCRAGGSGQPPKGGKLGHRLGQRDPGSARKDPTHLQRAC